MKSMPFGDYARFYDALYADKDYVQEAKFVNSCIRSVIKRGKKIVEFGCGTARHAVCLAKLGYHIHGYDMSTTMLAIAKQRIASLPTAHRQRIAVAHHDITSIQGHEEADAVISLFHVMSYQTTQERLSAAFQSAHSCLKKGGVFLFDYWHGAGVLSDPPQCRLRRVHVAPWEVMRIAESQLHCLSNTVDVHYTLIAEHTKNKNITTNREVHTMRYLFPTELDVLAQQNGFKSLGHKEWLTDATLNSSMWNAYVLYIKV